MAIDILIQGDYRDRDIKRAHRDLDLLGSQAGTTGSAFTKMSGFAAGMGAAVGAAAIAAAAAGAQMAIEFGVNGVKAFIDDEAAAAKLAKTMSNLGMEGATAAVETTVDSFARMTGTADDLLRPAMDRLLRSTNNVALATETLKLAQDIAAGTGKSLEVVVAALGRGFDGSTAGLSRLGAGLDKATLATGDMDLITQKLADTFGGQAAVKAATFQGQIDRVGVAFSELQEAFGEAFMEGVASGFADGTDAGDALTQVINDLYPSIVQLGTVLGEAAVYLPNFVAGLKSVLNQLAITRDALLLTIAAFIAFKQITKDHDIDAAQKTLADANAALQKSLDAAKASVGEMVTTSQALKTATSGTVGSAIAAGNAYTHAGQSHLVYGQVLTQGTKIMNDYSKATNGSPSSFGGSASSAAEKIVVLTDKQRNLALTMAGSQVALKQATDDLKAIKDSAEAYAESTTKAIQGTVSLSTAFGDALKASEEGSLAAGQTVAGATIANLKAQLEATAAFEASLKAIIAAGGSMALIEQLRQTAAAQGMPAGVFLAGEVLTGGFVPELTALLTDFDVFATEAGTAMANNFFGQGIADADALLNGLSAEVAAQKKQLDRLGRNIGLPIAAAISEEIAQAIRDGVADGRAVAARRRASAFAAASFVPITVAPGTSASSSGGGFVPFYVAGFANGGSVMGGRPIVVGERGPELFVPGSSGSVVPNNAMGGNTYQITVQAGVGDPRAIGQQIVEYVRKFEQANGPVFRAA